jgi:sporulation protein YlmC with PRC-barrel domain
MRIAEQALARGPRSPTTKGELDNDEVVEDAMRTLDDVRTWVGRTMVDADGDKIGTIENIYLDRQTGEPEWAAVKTGLFGLKHSVVPIRDADPSGDDQVRVPFQKDEVKHAPRVDPDDELSEEEERKLYEHYGRSDYDEWQGEDRTSGLDLPAERPTTDAGAGGAAGGGNGETPRIVGVRLRRVVVVATTPIGDEGAEDRTER